MPLPNRDHPEYLVGIDLGTTHTVVACTRLSTEGSQAIELFPIDQSIKPGEVGALPLLPSVRYQASLDELAEADAQLPWPPSEPADAGACRPVIGELARMLGAKSRGRLIASAKSWLSHPTADRNAAILPWGAPDDVPKISPVTASASYLRHVRAAWDFHHPTAPLAAQSLVITVPASFDEAARALTLQAARLAGLPNLRLLEEPQAACYDWLFEHRNTLETQLGDTRLLLVVDIGGGTLDLTLIKVEPGGDEPRLNRVAVGNHLMLGGDNMDLALAHLAEQRMVGEGGRLSASELSQLVEQCRRAKERLLSESAPVSVSVTLLGSGSRLIAAARSAELSRDEVQRIVLDGFFPAVAIDELPERKRSGVVEFGLPYVADPAMTRHLAAFLSEHRFAATEAGGTGPAPAVPIPDAVLLNGGIFRSPLIVQRLVSQLAAWGGQMPRVLSNARPDQAVAFGAVAYGLARRGQAVQRIGGGAARSYFLVVESAVEGVRQGVCILPRGTEEGAEIVLQDRSFKLTLGKPVRFSLMSATDDARPAAGALVELDDEHYHALPPLALALGRDEVKGGDQQIVRIAAGLSEVGTLDLHCVAVDPPEQRWSIEFQLRGAPRALALDATDPRLAPAREHILQVFGKKTRDADPKSVKTLRQTLEKLLGPRAEWDTPVLRELFAGLLEGLPNRRRSAEHERLWLSLVGFSLRPGFGYPLDDWRVEQIFSLYQQGLQFVNESQNWAEWWTLWRRIAGGLNPLAQEKILDDLADFINPETARRGNLPTLAKKRSYDDMVRLVAVLERLPAPTKVRLGGWLLQRLSKAAEPAESWWALGRIGSREPFHGSAHEVVPTATAEEWLKRAMQHDFRKQPQPAFAAALLARRCGDRARDIDSALRDALLEQLRAARSPESWQSMVTEFKPLSEADVKRIYGEALPPGLALIG